MSYNLLPLLSTPLAVSTAYEDLPKVGYWFFLTPDNKYGHHILLHKTGYFIGAVREFNASNIESALSLHGGAHAFKKITTSDDVTPNAALAFSKALAHSSVSYLVQSVVLDITIAAQKEDVFTYIVKFLQQSRLPVACVNTSYGIDLVMNGKVLVSVNAPNSTKLKNRHDT